MPLKYSEMFQFLLNLGTILSDEDWKLLRTIFVEYIEQHEHFYFTNIQNVVYAHTGTYMEKA